MKHFTLKNEGFLTKIGMFSLVFILFIACQSQLDKDAIIEHNKAVTTAEIVRKTIAPKEKEIIHYKFEIEGQVFTGNQWVRNNRAYKTGDVILIDYAQNEPKYNRISEE